jgi:hypothetical protein
LKLKIEQGMILKMKHITHLFCLFTMMLYVATSYAQTYKTINVESAGTLSSLLTSTEKSTLTQLTVSGYIDARDIKCMRDELTVLSVIDISNASIVAYSGSLGTYPGDISYANNELPLSSFLLQPNTPKLTLTSILLPTSLASISSYAFAMCTNLKPSIKIPSAVTNIGNYAFMGCTGLTKISVLAATPPTATSTSFLGMNQSSCTLEVATGTKALYVANSIWSVFNPIVEKSFTTDVTESIKRNCTLMIDKSNIIIRGTKEGDRIYVFEVNGVLFKSVTSAGTEQIIPCEKAKTYFVKINQSTYKVQL